MPTPRPPRNPRTERRRGVAAVEFAVCLPVILLLTFGMIEACTATFLKQSLSVAAYEAGHTAVQSNATAGDAKKVADAILTSRRVTGATTTVSPSNLGSVAEGDLFTVTITAPVSPNAFLYTGLYAGGSLSASVTLMKEHP